MCTAGPPGPALQAFREPQARDAVSPLCPSATALGTLPEHARRCTAPPGTGAQQPPPFCGVRRDGAAPAVTPSIVSLPRAPGLSRLGKPGSPRRRFGRRRVPGGWPRSLSGHAKYFTDMVKIHLGTVGVVGQGWRGGVRSRRTDAGWTQVSRRIPLHPLPDAASGFCLFCPSAATALGRGKWLCDQDVAKIALAVPPGRGDGKPTGKTSLNLPGVEWSPLPATDRPGTSRAMGLTEKKS